MKRHAADVADAPTKRPCVERYLPNELWCLVMEFAPDWATARALSQCSAVLNAHVECIPVAQLQRYQRYATERLALEQCSGRAGRLAVMNRQCQLCGRGCHRGHVPTRWPVYAHADCVAKQLVSLKQAMKTYDFTFEQLYALPQLGGMLWKYHGGQPGLPFTVNDTLQGLCLRMHHESLYDRRVRIDAMRARLAVEDARLGDAQRERDAQVQHAMRADTQMREEARRVRIDEVVEGRIARLDALLRDCQIHRDLAGILTRCLCASVRMPVSWKQLEDLLVELRALSADWTAAHTRTMRHFTRLVLKPKVLRAALDAGPRFRQVLRSSL